MNNECNETIKAQNKFRRTNNCENELQSNTYNYINLNSIYMIRCVTLTILVTMSRLGGVRPTCGT